MRQTLRASQKVTLEVNSDVSFGKQSQFGDQVKVHYAGILAKNSKLFDSSMEYVWNTYPYYNDGVSEPIFQTVKIKSVSYPGAAL